MLTAEPVKKGVTLCVWPFCDIPSRVVIKISFRFSRGQKIFLLKADFGLCQIGSVIETVGDELIFSHTGQGPGQPHHQ
jgi:hypothetical protein